MKGRKKISRVISWILVLCMILTLIPYSAIPAKAAADSMTATNVQKVMDYVDQLRTANARANEEAFRLGKFTWDTENREDSWRYFNGFMMDAFIMTSVQANKDYANSFYDAQIKKITTTEIAADGTITETITASIYNYIAGELDSIIPARPLFDLLEYPDHRKYEAAIQTIYSELEKQKSYDAFGGNYLHKQTTDGTQVPPVNSGFEKYQIALDGLYMAQPFLMECAKAIEAGEITLTDATGNPVTAASIRTDVYNRMTWVAENMKVTNGLYHHGWNTADGVTERGNGHYWSRAIGWYAMALADVIDLMPEGTERTALIGQLQTLFDSMLPLQDTTTGMWYNVPNRGSDLSNNRLETSGTAMMAYAMMMAYDKGWIVGEVTIDSKTYNYGKAGLDAFNGIINNKMTGVYGSYAIEDTYTKSGVGETDAYYCNGTYTTDEAKGTAAVIMAATYATSVSEKLLADKVITEAPVVEAEGTVLGNGTYKLAKELKVGSKYLIVSPNQNGTAYAARNNGKAAGTIQEVKIDGENAIISANETDCVWEYVEVTGGSNTFKNDTMYVRLTGAEIFNASPNTRNTLKSTINKTTGEAVFYKDGGESGTSVYVEITSTGVTGQMFSKEKNNLNDPKPTIYFYEQITAPTEQAVTFSVDKTTESVAVGGEATVTPTVMIGSTTANSTVATSYDITWSSDNEAIAKIVDGKIIGVKPGTTRVRAILNGANGGTLSSPIERVITVVVSNQAIGTGEIPGTSTYTLYTGNLETTDKDKGYEFLIVNSNTAGPQYAVMNNNTSKGTVQQVTISEDGLTATITENAAACEWKYTKGKDANGNDKYSFLNGQWYIRLGSKTEPFNKQVNSSVIQVDKVESGYYIFKDGGSSGTSSYLTIPNQEGAVITGTDIKGQTNIVKPICYLYQKNVVTTDTAVTFEIDQASVSIKEKDQATITPTITVVGETVTSSDIVWTTSNSAVATVNNGAITGVREGKTVVTASLVSVNGKALSSPIELSIDVNVTAKAIQSTSLNGHQTPITVEKGVAPTFNNIVLTVTYEDNTTEDITVANGLQITGYNINKIAFYTASISYKGIEYGTVEINVTGDPFAGLENATTYPEYPNDGAVRIKKSATGEDFQNTGVAKVELDTAGITVKQGLDVVLVVDVSNSMGWTDDWFVGMTDAEVAAANDQAKIPTGTAADTTDKLDMAMKSAQNFANILLGGNTAGSQYNNSLSFVTFAGYDADNTNFAATDNNARFIDSVQTIFTNVQDATTSNRVFADTKFTEYVLDGEKSVKYTLQIGGLDAADNVTGENRGNTNYDYAFAEAQKAVEALQTAVTTEQGKTTYAETGRETVVIFMTDGAPSHYNNIRVSGTNHQDTKYGTAEEYTNSTATDQTTWLEEVHTQNTYATALYNNVNRFYAVGFDLNHGGFGTNNGAYSWSQEDLGPILEDMASSSNKINVTLASDGNALDNFYHDLANGLKYAGTYAKVTDVIDPSFTLQRAEFGPAGSKTTSTIDIVTYELYSKADNVAEALIGTRKPNSEKVLETVTFSANGNTATSNLLGDVNILTTDATGNVTIEAKYFTYTNVNGTETFVWDIGNIDDKEVAFSYYAYLKDALDDDGNNTAAEPGIYDTNKSAKLEYVNIEGKKATQTYEKPKMSWGGALTEVEYYLVNEDGQPVNTIGEVIPFENRIIVSTERQQYPFTFNTTQHVDGATHVPAGYNMYNPDASYNVTSSSGTNTGVTSELVISDSKNVAGSTTDVTTKVVEQNADFSKTIVAFGVVSIGTLENAGYSLKKDQVVVDYGKAIVTDVLANDTSVIPSEYTAKITGFVTFNASFSIDKKQKTPGSASLDAADGYGTFTVVEGTGSNRDQVKFTLGKMLDKVQKVYVVVKMTSKTNTSDIYYMYNELDVIPATVMYYETDFAGNVFTFTNGTEAKSTWSTAGTPDVDDQDDGIVGTAGMIYGYDQSYVNDSSYSDGTSYKVEGEMDSTKKGMDRFKVQARFTFTGTGFDLISRTGTNQGYIRVDINQNGTRVKSITVYNTSESNLELYQIPVVSVNGLPHGTYDIVIGVNAAFEDKVNPQLSHGGEFYFDAVRIFDPINTEATTEDASTALAAYMTDGEAGATIKEVHQELINQATDTSTGFTSTPGVGFVDKNKGSEGLTEYSKIGPNNEVYLTQDQGLVFGINTNGQIPTSIDIGAKSADGNAVTMTSALLKRDGTTVINSREVALNTATAMFYDLAGGATLADTIYYVKIENKGTGILSITDVKVAYGPASTPAPAAFTFFTDAMAISLMSMDFPVVGPEVTEPEVPEVTDPEVPEVTDPEAPEEEETVIDSDCDIIDIEFNHDRIKLKKNAKLTFTTSDKVKTVVITDQYGNVVTEKISKKTKKGITTWKVEMKMTEIGEFTYTVIGYNEDGIPGTPAKIAIGVYRK